MNLKKLYETNADFRGYVDRYARRHRISLDEALTHKMVKIKAEDMVERGEGE